MTTPQRWTVDDLETIAAARELRIAAPAADRGWRRPVPIWVVVTDGSVYVRTWHRRTSGWYGAVLRSGRAHVQVPGLSRTVAVTDVADAGTDLCAAVDAAYRAKYATPGDHSVSGMITDEAARTTLLLAPLG